MTPFQFFCVLVSIIGFGAFLSWLGRSWAALMVSYFVVGVVGLVFVFLGFAAFQMAVYGNDIAGKINNPYLLFILKIVDLGDFATFLTVFDVETRKIILLSATAVSVVTFTLPFVIFANAIYSALTADEAPKAIMLAKDDIKVEIQNQAKSAGEKADTLNRIIKSQKDAIQSLQGEICTLKKKLES